MSDAAQPVTPGDDAVQPVTGDGSQPDRQARAWLTILAVGLCVLNWVAVNDGDIEDWEHLRRHGFYPAEEIWDGAWHALVTSAFVHTAAIHLIFNAYWLYYFGSRFEREYGSLKFLAFCTAAAIVSSSFELAHSDTTGIGISGVVYALFAYMWPMRHRVPAFEEAIPLGLAQSFVVFALICVLVTWAGIHDFGNAAHISGILFGGTVAGLWGSHYRPRLMASSLILLLVLSIGSLMWAPWSTAWLAHQGYRAHVAGDLPRAVEFYSQALNRDPELAHVWFNRGLAYDTLGQSDAAQRDYARAGELDPTVLDALNTEQDESQETP